MNIGLFLGHPAHFHVLKNVANNLMQDGHKVFFVAKKKDILEDLLQAAGFSYTLIRQDRGNKTLDLVWSVLHMERGMCRFIRDNHIDILLGSTLTFAARCIMHIPVLEMGEDDAAVVPRMAAIAYPFASHILSPVVCNNGRWERKSVKYPGYQKLAYLHPKRFVPDREVVEKYGIEADKPYFLLRFASLKAHHDGGIHGITTEVAQHLIDMLTPHGRVLITSERELEPQFEQYRLHINPLDIHHVMAYATLYLGDSQSMAVEAAMLGVPSLRFNDFVGAKKISVLEELEHDYELTYGIASAEPERLYEKVAELLAMPDLRSEWQQRREKMLSEKIDVTAFFTWFIEKYPESAEITRQRQTDDEFWRQF